MLAKYYGAQRYFIRDSWKAFEKQLKIYQEEGFDLTSLASYSKGFAGVMSEISGWHHPGRNSQLISSLKDGERDLKKEGAITALLLRDETANLYSHEGTGITGQYLARTLAALITNEFLAGILKQDYFLTETAMAKEEAYLVFSSGLDWDQSILRGALSDLGDEYEVESKNGSIVTEFFSHDLSTYTMILSSNTGYSEQYILKNPGSDTFQARYFKQGYRITMVRGVKDDIYVFLSR